MILLRKSIGVCVGYRSHFLAQCSFIAVRCKSVQAPVSKKYTVIKPRICKHIKAKEITIKKGSRSIEGKAKSPTKSKTKKAAGVPKNALKEFKSTKSPIPSPKNPKTESIESGIESLAKITAAVKIAKVVWKPSFLAPIKPMSSKIATVTSKPAKSDTKDPPSEKSTTKRKIENAKPRPSPKNAVKERSLKESSKYDATTEAPNKALSPSRTVENAPKFPMNQSYTNLNSGVKVKTKMASFHSFLINETTATIAPKITVKDAKSDNDKSTAPVSTHVATFNVNPESTTPVNWSTFLYDIFGTSSNKKVVDLIQPSKYESRVDEYSYETKRRKKALEMKRGKPNFRGFKFINYDKLAELGVRSYQFNNEESSDTRVSVNKQHLLLAHDSLVPSITIKQPECLNFRNPTGLVSLEQIGQLLIYEHLLTLSLMNNFNPHKMWVEFRKKCEGLQFIQVNESATILFLGLQPLNVFTAMAYLEDKDYDYAIKKFFKQLAMAHKLNTNFTTELLIDKHILSVNAYLQQFPAPINFNIFSQVFRPPLLNSLLIKLPAMPKLQNQELYKVIQVSLLSPRTTSFVQYPELVFLRERLDSFGDVILKRYSVEYMVHYSKGNSKFRWNMDDVDFINTNIVFSSLSFAYKLHQALNDTENQAKMNHIITSNDLNIANELLGDMFERVVAIEYLDNPEVCRTWIFKIYDVILANLTKEHDGIEFIDKEKYVKLYEYHLRTKTMY